MLRPSAVMTDMVAASKNSFQLSMPSSTIPNVSVYQGVSQINQQSHPSGSEEHHQK